MNHNAQHASFHNSSTTYLVHFTILCRTSLTLPQARLQESNIQSLVILWHTSYPSTKSRILEDTTSLEERRCNHVHAFCDNWICEHFQDNAQALARSPSDCNSVLIGIVLYRSLETFLTSRTIEIREPLCDADTKGLVPCIRAVVQSEVEYGMIGEDGIRCVVEVLPWEQ